MKKGFTLIELLAVIVILAIVAIIATPIILNIIEDSRKQAVKSSAELYVDGLTKQIASKNMINEFNPSSCTISNGNVTCDNTPFDYQTNGDKPTSGSISFNNGVVTGYTLTISGYIVTKNQNGVSITKVGSVVFNGTIETAVEGATYIAIVYMDPTDLSTTCSAQLAAQNLNDKPLTTPTGIKSGCMKFYLYDDSGSTYKLILDHNTTASIGWISEDEFIAAGGTSEEYGNFDTSNVSTMPEPATFNAQLASDTEGWVGNPRLITADEIAHIVGADTALNWNSNKTFVTENEFSNGATEVSWFYLDGTGSTYATWQNDSNSYGPIVDYYNSSSYAWLYDYTNDCENYGCLFQDYNLYDGLNVGGYWTSTTSINNYGVPLKYEISYSGLYSDIELSSYGIRPVVEIPKSTLGALPAPTITHKGIVYLDPTNTSRTCTASDVAANVTANGKLTGVHTGCMKFYIYDDSGSNYKMILDHNTSYTVAWAENVSDGPVEANAQLALDTAGWSGNPRLITANEIAHIIGADTALGWDSSKQVGDPSYDATQVNDVIFDGTGSTYEEWNSVYSNYYLIRPTSTYAWLFNNTNYCRKEGCTIEDPDGGIGYWTSSPAVNSYSDVWHVTFGSLLHYLIDGVTDGSEYGIRPVIELPKSSVTVH